MNFCGHKAAEDSPVGRVEGEGWGRDLISWKIRLDRLKILLQVQSRARLKSKDIRIAQSKGQGILKSREDFSKTFPLLLQCFGLASVFPGPSTAEGVLSIQLWKKFEPHVHLVSLSSEGVLI